MEQFEHTFDDAAREYDALRPMYPKELFEAIFEYQPISEESQVLEIGAGSGKATRPFLDTECHLIAIEPGEHLANFMEHRYQRYMKFSIQRHTLQEFEAPDASFDLVYAATSFHWIPEEYGYKRVYQLLNSNGAFARFGYHAEPDLVHTDFMEEMQVFYRKYMHSAKEPKVYSEEDAKQTADIAKKYGFTDICYHLYHMKKVFTAQDYRKLLTTYPDHMAMEAADREKLFDGITSTIEKYGGSITIPYAVDLQLARKE